MAGERSAFAGFQAKATTVLLQANPRGAAALLDRLDIASQPIADAAALGHEVAHKTRQLALRDAQHVVQHQNLAGNIGPGPDADDDQFRVLHLNPLRQRGGRGAGAGCCHRRGHGCGR